jgi:hypothetical protein
VQVLWEGLQEGDHSEDRDVDGNIGSEMDLREIDCGGLGWIQSTQDKARWWAIVNTVMNLQVLAPRS